MNEREMVHPTMLLVDTVSGRIETHTKSIRGAGWGMAAWAYEEVGARLGPGAMWWSCMGLAATKNNVLKS
jgi:hypothetical protein